MATQVKHTFNALIYTPLQILWNPLPPLISALALLPSPSNPVKDSSPSYNHKFWLLQLRFVSWHHQLAQPSQMDAKGELRHGLHRTCYKGSSVGPVGSTEALASLVAASRSPCHNLEMGGVKSCEAHFVQREERNKEEWVNSLSFFSLIVSRFKGSFDLFKDVLCDQTMSYFSWSWGKLATLYLLSCSLFYFSFSLAIASLGLNLPIKH